MKKILIVGCSGAGKSTLARKLGEILNIKVIHIDKLFWNAGWESISRDKLKEKLRIELQKETWIIDGNYSSTIEMRLKEADTVIFLDFSRLVCFWRVFKRRIIYSRKERPDISPGCPEKIDIEFLKWIWNFPGKVRPVVYKEIEKYAENYRVFILKSSVDVKKFLSGLSS